MERIGIRELRRQTTAVIRRVEAGESFEITDQRRVVALLVGMRTRGLAALIEQGMVRAAEGSLLEIEPLQIPRGSRPPSSVVAEGRGEGRARKLGDPH
ncbi:MAG: hypothetical protein HY678_03760 [Chloroflexi bacterium]|nr:hypothetical protein [Chloroflexota bacterium]